MSLKRSGGSEAAPQRGPGPGGRAGTLRAEAEAVAQLQHPHIVQVFEIGEHQDYPYFSMEYVAGGSLAHKLRQTGKPMPAAEAARMVETLSRAMHYAHERGVVHRDLKPANVLLTQDGLPKIADFGLVKRRRR